MMHDYKNPTGCLCANCCADRIDAHNESDINFTVTQITQKKMQEFINSLEEDLIAELNADGYSIPEDITLDSLHSRMGNAIQAIIKDWNAS